MTFFLIGFMGSGKTHWGKIWAAARGFTFVDLDEAIEAREGQTIASIFERKGEEYFRKVETQVLRTYTGLQNAIIACGGGTPCFFDNIQWMNDHGTTVYLKTTPSEILKRVLLEQEKRPLLKKMNPGELLFFIEQKLKERSPFYMSAKQVLPVETVSAETFETLLNTVHPA